MSDPSTPHPEHEPTPLGAPPERTPLTAALCRDGRSLSLLPTKDGGVIVTTTRALPLEFDRFQALALREAFASMPLAAEPAGNYQFARGLGR